MEATGMLQEGAGGRVYVVYPTDPASFERQARRGSRYVEFDVPSESLRPGGKDDWFYISGPGDLLASRLAARRGTAPPQLPTVENVVWIASKLPIR
jgi:hypothetical protein